MAAPDPSKTGDSASFMTQKGDLGLATDEAPPGLGGDMPSPVTQSSQSAELILARKRMTEVQALLDSKKSEFRERMEKCKERESALAGRQEDMREQVAKFAKFMKENDQKRTRALKRANDEIALRKAKEKEIESIAQQISGF